MSGRGRGSRGSDGGGASATSAAEANATEAEASDAESEGEAEASDDRDGGNDKEKDGKTSGRRKKLPGRGEHSKGDDSGGGDEGDESDRPPELHSTVCVSGWLREKTDYQRPWGVTPTDPPIVKTREVLERFYSVYDPPGVRDVKSLLDEYEGREDELWKELREEYGRDPDHTLPVAYGDVEAAKLSDEEGKVLADVLSVVIVSSQERKKKRAQKKGTDDSAAATTTSRAKKFFRRKAKHHAEEEEDGDVDGDGDDEEALRKRADGIASFFKEKNKTASEITTAQSPKESDRATAEASATCNGRAAHFLAPSQRSFDDLAADASLQSSGTAPPVWDFLSLYGSDLYTVTWESSQLTEVSDCVNELALKAASSATKEAMKRTAAATLLAATALPGFVISAANSIDEPWTVLSERADMAGRELALCLLQAEERRPVTLAGYSFGARVVLSCLRELDRHQEIWEERRRERSPGGESSSSSSSSTTGGDTKIPSKKKKKKKNKKRKGELAEYVREPSGIVEDAVLMGTPKYISKKDWTSARRATGGRLIHCYSRRDWVLSLMFKRKNLMGFYKTAAGTAPIRVEGVCGVENYDVTHLITGHSAYCARIPHVLEAIGFGEPDPGELEVDRNASASSVKA